MSRRNHPAQNMKRGRSDQKPDLVRLVRTWQPRLRLQDWEIKIRWVPSDDVAKNMSADCDVCGSRKTATIRVKEWADLEDKYRTRAEIENSVVHELIHVHLDPFARDLRGLKNELMEQAVDQLTRAFLAAYGA